MAKTDYLALDILDFFRVTPSGTQQDFVDFVVALGHASASETSWFADHLVAVLVSMLVLPDGSDFADMMARATAATEHQRAVAIRNAVVELRRDPAVRVSEIDEEVALLGDRIAQLEEKHQNGQAGRDWLEENGPAVEPLKGDTLAVLAVGIDSYAAAIAGATRKRDDLLAERDRIEAG